MDRDEPLPDWVVGYRGGVRYHDAATRARAREEAVRVVDGRRGYSFEFSADPATHQLDYDEEQARILAGAGVASPETPGGRDGHPLTTSRVCSAPGR